MTRSNHPPCKRFFQLIILGWALFFMPGFSSAVPAITNVDPATGQVGQDLEVTIQGSGFAANPRVIFYPDSGNMLKILGSAGAALGANDVSVACNTAYITTIESSLQIVDVATSTDPVLLSTTTLPSQGIAIGVQNSMAYVLTENHGLFIFDVTDPSRPAKIGELSLPAVQSYVMHYSISLAGQFAYVAIGSSGLYVINVSDPRNPTITGHAATSGDATGVSVEGQWAYVSVFDFGLVVFDVGNPAAPRLKGSVPMEYPMVMDVSVLGQAAYVLNAGESDLKVIDINDPQHPVIVGSVRTAGFPLRIDVSNDRAYIAASSHGLHVIDISVPVKPVLLGSISIPGWTADVVSINGLAYVAADDLEIIDVGNISSSSIISLVPTPYWADGVAVNNSTAYVADYGGLLLYDLSNPAQPRLMATVPSPFLPQDVAVQDNTAYVADDWGLQIIDVSDGENPVPIDWVEIGFSQDPWEVEVLEKIAYVAAYEYGLQIIDVDPASPNYLDIIGALDTYTAEPSARGIEVVGSMAYLADEGAGLCLIDVSDPTAPVLTRTIEPTGRGQTREVAVAGNMAYLAVEIGGIQVVDLSNPDNSLRGSLGANIAGYDVILVGQTAYLASAWDGVMAVDVSDPDEPTFLAAIPTAGYAVDLAVVDNKVHVADAHAGLCILAAPRELVPVLDPVTPDILMTATLPAHFKGDYTLRAFDDTGSAELPGAVTIMEELPESKAVIVAGYGPHSSNKLWDETLVNANYAWNVLFAQGYAQENIRYLSPAPVDVNGDGTPDVNGDATLAELQSTLATWAADADDLILYLVGHGSNESFVLKHNDAIHEELAAGVLAGWLDSLQAAHGMRVIGVYEACYSGSFLETMQVNEGAGFERMLLTSSTATQVSILGNKGLTSFSHRFWESLYEQGELVRAFTEASGLMAGFGQVPWLDGNCDGMPNTAADSVRETIVGRGYNFQSPLKPFVSCSPPDQVLRNTRSAILWAKTVSANPIGRVWAEIIPPNYNPLAPEAPSLPTVELSWSNSRRRYEGSYSQFYERGTYHVALYAMDNQQIVSLPRISRISVPPFSWNLFLPAIIGNSDGLKP